MSAPKKLIFITSCFDELKVAAVIRKLTDKNVPWFRFNTETFPLIFKISLHCSNHNEVYATLSDGNNIVDTRQITSVWYRRFGDLLLNAGIADYEERFVRSECSSLLHSLFGQIKCFSVNPRQSENQANVKVYQLQVAKQVGLSVPLTLITNQPDEVRSFVANHLGPVLFKPIAGPAVGGGPARLTKEIEQAYAGQFVLPPAQPVDSPGQMSYAVFSKILTSEYMEQIDRIAACPVVFQAYIEKHLELRITIVGEAIFAAEIHSQEYEDTKIDWRYSAMSPNAMPTHKIHNLPDEVSNKLLSLMKHLGLVFGCIDMILTPEGEYVFLEVNPGGQWGWVEKLTGMPITDALTDMLIRGSAGVGS